VPSDDAKGLEDADPLMVRSVEKAFRVLEAFDGAHRSLSLAQIGASVGLDKSAAQRFTHTLNRLGYLKKDPVTKRFELSLRSLEMARHFISANPVIRQAMPYLLHLSRETEEAVNLTLPDGPDIVFAARFMSRHTLHTDVAVGTRLDAARLAGYATTWSEYYPGDLSVAAAVLDPQGRPIGAVNIGVSSARYTPEKAEAVQAPLVIAAARSISQASSAS